jgi:hypothetical protein
MSLPIPTVIVHDEPRWEYKRMVRNLRTEDAPDEAELNALGGDGWELVGLFSDSPFLYLYLKRPA